MIERRGFRDDRGQALVEFSLVVVVLMMLVLGVVGFGNVYGEYETLISATSAAARFESICKSASSGDASTIGQNAAPNISPTPTFTFVQQGTSTAVSYAAGCSGVTEGEAITVTGTASSVAINLGLFKVNVPLQSSLTVTEQ